MNSAISMPFFRGDKLRNSFRYANIDDAEGIAKLIRALALFKAINDLPEAEAVKKVQQDLKMCLSQPESHSVYVCEDIDGGIEGYTSVHWLPYMILSAPEGYVSELFVHPDARGRGTGAGLLNMVIEEGQTRGCKRLSLLNVKHRESYQRQFYAKNGWREREDMANFVFDL